MKKIIMVLVLLLLTACVGYAEYEDVTHDCKFRSNGKNIGMVTDKSIGTIWSTSNPTSEIYIMLPDGGADVIEIAWKHVAEQFTLTQYDEQQNVISERDADDEDGYFLTQAYRLDSNAKYVFISYTQENQGVCRIRLYKGDSLPETVNHWKGQNEKCDLMVFSTHQDDEWLWFGGIIPYYDLVKDKNVQVVYMANCSRSRYQEALNGLTVAGIRTEPVFLGFKDERISSYSQTVEDWGGTSKILEALVDVIRHYKPEVILTHDWDGEYGHNQHKVTSRSMEYAIEAAADPTQFAESYEKYGAWQVKKLYRHLEEKQQIQFDWHIAYDELGGRTCLQTATDAMNCHESQLKWYQVEDHGKYDNSLFGLSYSTVGDDVKHDDLFENID